MKDIFMVLCYSKGMKTELTILAYTVVLGFLQLFSAAAAATKARGLAWNLSSRDKHVPPLDGKAARLDRAFQNFKETFPFFLAAVVLVTVTDRSGSLSQIGAVAYLLARIVYIPLYVFNVVGIRSLVWGISAASVAAMLLQLLF